MSPHAEVDMEKEQGKAGSVHSVEIRPADAGSLHRQLKNRHITMIAVAGVIGTGLFLGTASSLHNGGPLGLLLGYGILASICISVMISLGEMVALLPLPGGHIRLAERFVDPAFSFALGWNYVYSWALLLPTELSAAAVLIGFWDSDTNPAVWIAMCAAVVITINMLGAGAYGECEFWFASIKVITITALIIGGIVLDLGGGPHHDRIGFRYWKDPGPLTQFNGISGSEGRLLGFVAVLVQAAFSMTGTEIVAIAAGEAKNPRASVIKAARRVCIRIVLFYICGVLVIGLLVPSNDPNLTNSTGTAAQSPFVIAIKAAGIAGVPSVLNAAILTSAWSAASSDLYTSSRGLYGLALAGNAPRFFLRTTGTGMPWVTVSICSCFSLLAFMSVNNGASTVFGWLVNLTAISGLLSWFGISVTYLRFYRGLRVQGMDRKQLPFSTKLQPFAAWYAAISCVFICLISGWTVFLKHSWNTATFVTNYLPVVAFPIMYFGARKYLKANLVRPADMAFDSQLVDDDEESCTVEAPNNIVEALWKRLIRRL